MITYHQHNGLTHPPVMAKFKLTLRPYLGIDIREGPTPDFHLRGTTPQHTLRNFLQYSLDALKTVTYSFYKQASILAPVTSQRSSNLKVLLLGLLTLWTTSLPVAAATIVVNSNLDTTGTVGICTLRDAITAANTDTAVAGCTAGNSADTIIFALSLSGQTITLTSVLPPLKSNLTIDGSSLASHVQISGNNTYQVFDILSGTVILTHLDIINGGGTSGNYNYSAGGIRNKGTLTVNNTTFTGNSGSWGGGIEIKSGTLTTVNNSTFAGNSAGWGGGIYILSGPVTVNNSTFSGNSAGWGGGINAYSGPVTVNNSTFSGNSAVWGGGISTDSGTMTVNNSTFAGNSGNWSSGIYTFSGTMTVNNSILANNGTDCYVDRGTFTGDHNLMRKRFNCGTPSLTADPMLDPLANYGGSTQTFALLAGSPAIDKGNSATCLTTDQRGYARVGTCDMGAFEYGGVPPTYAFSTVKDPASTGTGSIATTTTTNGNYTVGTAITLVTTGLSIGETVTWSPTTCAASFPMPASTLTCTATFTAAPTYAFSTVKDPASTGTGSIATITTANGNYAAGTTITLATTGFGAGETVTWSPATCATSFPMPASALTCTATFAAAVSPSTPVTPITPVIPTTPITPTTPVMPATPVTSGTSSLPDSLGLFLQVDGSGEGKVMTDTGLSCQSRDCQVNQEGELVCNPLACNQAVKTGTTVTLTPQADAGSVFSSWGGSEDCVDGRVFMNGGHLCIAFFHRIDSLRVTLQGQGQVMGYGSDQQLVIDCGKNCQAFFSRGTPVSLQAIPSQGMMFGGWSGECGQSTQNPLVLEVTQDMECQATFVAPVPGVTPPPLPVTPATMDIPTDTTPARDTTTEFTTPVTLPEVPTDLPGVTASPVATPQPQSAEVDSTAQGTIPATDTMHGVPTPWPSATMLPPVVTLPQPESEAVETHMQGTTPSLEVTPLPVTTLPLVQGPDFFHCATTGDVDDVCNYGGQEVINLNVQTHGLVSNGVVQTTLVNQGWVSNFTITETGQLRGGVVTGYIKNQGVMLDFDFKGLSLIGGTLGGIITNTSRVGGYFQDVMLQANTKITGGTLQGILQGDQQSPALLEHVTIKTGSYLLGIKLGQGVKLEGQVVIEPLEEMPGGQATE